jgi:hypothetical protein
MIAPQVGIFSTNICYILHLVLVFFNGKKIAHLYPLIKFTYSYYKIAQESCCSSQHTHLKKQHELREL